MDQANRDYFENYEMHQFFYDVYSNARTGVLKVYFPDSVVKTVYFSEGNIVYASSNGEKDKLITILIKYKKLTQEQLDAALRQMDKNISLGRNLVNMGFITHKELIWAVKVQVISIIHSIIVLKQGDYHFSEGPLPDGVINLPLNTMKVIFDSIIMFQDREWIAEKIQQPDTIYKKTLLFEEGKNRLITNPDLLEVAEAIDGKRTLADLTGMTTLEDFKVFKLLYSLKFLTLIEERMPEATLPSSEDIFEIQDEPEEDLELAEEAFVHLGESAENLEQKEEPTERLEKDQLPFPAPEIDQEEPTEKIDISISDQFEPEVEFSEPEAVSDSEESDKDVFVEFKLKEDELSYEEESVEDELQSGNHLEFESDADELVDQPDTTSLEGDERGFALTEQDIDSVIMDNDEQSPEMEKETYRLERTDSQEIGDFGVDADATLVESTLPDSESFDEEMIDASAGGDGGKWLLISLIVISVILFVGTMYYYQFWLPQQQNAPTLPSEKTQIEQAAPKEDVTTSSITSLEKSDVTSPSTSESELPLVGNGSPSSGVSNGKETKTAKENAAKSISEETPNSSIINSEKLKQAATPEVEPSQKKEPLQKQENRVKDATENQRPSSDNQAKPEVSSVPGTNQTKSLKTRQAQTTVPQQPSSSDTVDSIVIKYASYLDKAETTFNSANAKALTLQLEVACKAETIQQALRLLKSPEDIYLVPFKYGGSDCVIVCFGLFDSNQEAMKAMNSLPQVFYEDNNEPFVASISRLKRRFQ
jgi:hypothetical protein